jgi:thiol:disulfide interchange protein DsbD
MTATTLRLISAFAAALLLPAGLSLAQGLPGANKREPQSGEEAVKVAFAVVGEAKPGATVRVAATFDIVPGWHIYWENAGESGAPTQIALELPKGCTVASRPDGKPRLDFPVPSVFTHGETVFGYENSVTLSTEVTLPPSVPAEGLPVVATATWLVCKGRCMMGRAESRIDLTKPVAADSKPAKALAESLSRLPKPLPPGWKASLEEVGPERAVIQVEGPSTLAADAAWQFIPKDTPGVLLESGYRAEAKGRILRVPLVLSRESSLGQPLQVAGLLVFGKNEPAFAFSIPVPAK